MFAGVRKQADGDALVASAPKEAASRIKTLILDVTKRSEIDFSVKQVEEELRNSGGKLVGLVNNAGIVQLDPVEIEDAGKVQQQFDVNVFGAMNLSKAFLPLLRETVASRGSGSARIIFLGSLIQDTIAPFFGCYAATKCALEGWTDAFRCELQPQGILVSLIQPGVFHTELIDKSREDCLKHLATHQSSSDTSQRSAAELYAPAFKSVVEWYHKPPKSPLEWVAGEVDAILRCWAFVCPNKRMIGWDAYAVPLLSMTLPEELLRLIFAQSMKPAADVGLQKLIDLICKYNPPQIPYNGNTIEKKMN